MLQQMRHRDPEHMIVGVVDPLLAVVSEPVLQREQDFIVGGGAERGGVDVIHGSRVA